jgi:enoyl-[acyl-carrier protein] reductase I
LKNGAAADFLKSGQDEKNGWKMLLTSSTVLQRKRNSAGICDPCHLQEFEPIMKEVEAMLSLTYIASEKAIPGYGGGMSSAKAQLESDTRVLAFEAGRKWGIRVNTISAGPLKSRAASAIGKDMGDKKKTFIELAIDYSHANAPLAQDLYSDDVGGAALFLCSPMARSVTGVTLYVDNGLHAMGMALDSQSMMA